MSDKQPHSHPLDSETDHRGVLNIVSWFLAIATTLVVFARLGTRFVVARKFEIDDGLIVASLLFAFGQTAALSVAVQDGLGLLDESYTTDDLMSQQQDIYAFNILFFVSQAFVKSSLVVFLRLLTPVVLHRAICNGLLAIIACWGIASLLGAAFPCSFPHVWMFIGNSCMNRLTFYTAIQAVNAALDFALIALPIIITWSLHLRRHRKTIVIAAFLTRTLVVAAIIAQIVMLYWSPIGPDPFLTWYFVLTTQIVEYLSIITANGPYLRPFLESLSTGMIGNDDIGRRYRKASSDRTGPTASVLSMLFRSKTKRPSDADPLTLRPEHAIDPEKLDATPRNHYAVAQGDVRFPIATQPEVEYHPPPQHIIQQVRTFTVRSDTEPPRVYAPRRN